MNIISREFRHAFHIKEGKNFKQELVNKDSVMVKERIHYDDGSYKDTLTKIVEPTRGYYITKKLHRNHVQKKEHEELYKLDKYNTTQSKLYAEINKRFSRYGLGTKTTKRDANMSPYLYGSDLGIEELIKHKYDTVLSKGKNTPYTVMYFDIENDVVTKEISVCTIIRVDFKSKKIISRTISNTNMLKSDESEAEKVKSHVNSQYKELMTSLSEKFTLDMQIAYTTSGASITEGIFQICHEWGEDIVTAWNIEHEMTIFEFNVGEERFKEIICDPSLSKAELEYKKLIKPNQKVTAGGLRLPVPPQKRAHKFRFPAKFHAIDAMLVYAHLRVTAKALLGGYSLENVLGREGGLSKMKFASLGDVNALTGVPWHVSMVKLHPMEYICYNIWDVLLMVWLEIKTSDLSRKMKNFSNKSLLENLTSSSRFILDDFHFYALDHGRALGTMVVNEKFGNGIGRRGWTIAMPPWARMKGRAGVLAGYIPKLNDNTALLVGDTDVVSAYPFATKFAGVSKDTTVNEVLMLEGISNHKKWNSIPKSAHTQRMKELNLEFFAGEASHVDYSVWMYDMPDFNELSNIVETKYGLVPKFKGIDHKVLKTNHEDTPFVNRYDDDKIMVNESGDNYLIYYENKKLDRPLPPVVSSPIRLSAKIEEDLNTFQKLSGANVNSKLSYHIKQSRVVKLHDRIDAIVTQVSVKPRYNLMSLGEDTSTDRDVRRVYGRLDKNVSKTTNDIMRDDVENDENISLFPYGGSNRLLSYKKDKSTARYKDINSKKLISCLSKSMI